MSVPVWVMLCWCCWCSVDDVRLDVTSAAHYTRRGNVELLAGDRYQRKERNKLCVLLLIIAVLAVALVIKLTRR